MNKRTLGAIGAAAMLSLTFAGTALADDIHQDTPIVGTHFNNTTVGCAEGWHFVHVGAKQDSLPSTLTATFKDAGTVVVDGYVNGNSTVMYNVYVDPSDTLLSASDEISNGLNLNLSHVCLPKTTSSTTTTDNETSTATTDNDTTTTTTDNEMSATTTTDTSGTGDTRGGDGGTTTTSGEGTSGETASGETTTVAGHGEGFTPPATDTIGAETSNSSVPTSMLLVLAGALSFVLVGTMAGARKRR